jgi:acetyltransferase-like isoleucine patch superfamily enzyme
MREKIRGLLASHPDFFKALFRIYNGMKFKNKLHGKGFKLSTGLCKINGLKIINKGIGNEIIIGDWVHVKNSTIVINGNYNKVIIGESTFVSCVEFYMEEDYNEILVGKRYILNGKIHVAAIEGTKIVFGDDGGTSQNTHFTTSDGHPIYDEQGQRINPAKDIIIDERVWIGTKVTCMKGVQVAHDSVVAATTTLTKAFDEPNVIIAGVPGKIVKRGITWDWQRH